MAAFLLDIDKSGAVAPRIRLLLIATPVETVIESVEFYELGQFNSLAEAMIIVAAQSAVEIR